MDEKDFWSALDYRVRVEMAGIEECKKKGLWTDGLIPHDYHFGISGCFITGRAWICFGDNQQQWDFRLDLPKGTRDLSEIDWKKLIPSSTDTKWMSLDYENEKMDLDPGSAVPEAP